MEEVWKDVPSRPELMASSWGRIKRKPHEVPMPNGGTKVCASSPTYGVTTRAKKGVKHVYKGYVYKGVGTVKVHQLVCEAFHGPKPFERAVVLHKDEDGLNNREENLRWGTQKENLNAPGFLEYCRSRRGKNSPRVKDRLR